MRHTEPMPPALASCRPHPFIVVDIRTRIIQDDCATRSSANIRARHLAEQDSLGDYVVLSREQVETGEGGQTA